jgi:hypothetical protein
MNKPNWLILAMLESMTAEELVCYTAGLAELTPLESALVNRLEHLLYETGWDCDGVSGEESASESVGDFWPTILRDPGCEELVDGWNT